MPFYVYEKEYDLRTCIVKIRINYFSFPINPFGDDPELRFDLLSGADFEQGYDDEDALVFYPNKMKFTFEDLSKRNYNILRDSLSTNEYSLPGNKNKYGGAKFWVNSELIFEGFIDTATLNYVEAEREITFEAIDLSVALKDMPVQRLTNVGNIYSLGYLIHVIYKQAYIPLQPNYYSHLNFDNGLYIKHDWIFEGKRTLTDTIIRDWSNAADFQQTYFNWESVNLYGDQRFNRTYSDLLRQLALQFGMIIGNLAPNKIYMVKRFGQVNPDVEVVDRNLHLDFERGIQLPALRGIRNKNIWNGERFYSAGEVRTLNNQISGELMFPNAIKDIETYIGSFSEPNFSGTAIYTASEYPVFDGIQDLKIDNVKRQIPQIICEWEYALRKKAKERFTGTLDGIHYSLIKNVRVESPDIIASPMTYRPIKVRKKYVQFETEMIGVEDVT